MPGAGVDVVEVDGAVSKGHVSDGVLTCWAIDVNDDLLTDGFAAGRTDEIPHSNHPSCPNNSDYII